MQDFNNYANNQGKSNAQNNADGDFFNLVNSLARSFDGKSQNELVSAVFEEAKRGKMNGTLTNADIDRFSAMLSPMLDDKKRKVLNKIVSELKKI
jgi:hypothetical protein